MSSTCAHLQALLEPGIHLGRVDVLGLAAAGRSGVVDANIVPPLRRPCQEQKPLRWVGQARHTTLPRGKQALLLPQSAVEGKGQPPAA
jgi:hypothetical protein